MILEVKSSIIFETTESLCGHGIAVNRFSIYSSPTLVSLEEICATRFTFLHVPKQASRTKHQDQGQTKLRKLGGFAFREDLPSSFFLETKG